MAALISAMTCSCGCRRSPGRPPLVWPPLLAREISDHGRRLHGRVSSPPIDRGATH